MLGYIPESPVCVSPKSQMERAERAGQKSETNCLILDSFLSNISLNPKLKP